MGVVSSLGLTQGSDSDPPKKIAAATAHHGALVDEGGGAAGDEHIGPHAVPKVLAVGGAEAPVADVAAAERRGREGHAHLSGKENADDRQRSRTSALARRLRGGDMMARFESTMEGQHYGRRHRIIFVIVKRARTGKIGGHPVVQATDDGIRNKPATTAETAAAAAPLELESIPRPHARQPRKPQTQKQQHDHLATTYPPQANQPITPLYSRGTPLRGRAARPTLRPRARPSCRRRPASSCSRAGR